MTRWFRVGGFIYAILPGMIFTSFNLRKWPLGFEAVNHLNLRRLQMTQTPQLAKTHLSHLSPQTALHESDLAYLTPTSARYVSGFVRSPIPSSMSNATR